ncbi:MAG: hypothetical protein ABIE70_12005 [bacterium]
MSARKIQIATLLLILVQFSVARARMSMPDHNTLAATPPKATSTPAHCLVAHRVGRIELAVANNGTFGREYHPGASIDWFTNEEILHSCQYPKNSNVSYLFGGAFWVGAIVGRDTLVSVGADGWQRAYEMYPDIAPFGEMIYRSNSDPGEPEFAGAISEEDYVAVYTDTLTEGVPADFFGRSHQPLNIEVTQASYAWSYDYAEDFVLFDYQIKNIGDRPLHEVYMAIYVDCMVCFDCLGDMWGFQDDHSGFLHTYPAVCGDCEYEDTVFAAWAADDDGDRDLVYNDGRTHPTPAATATRIIRTPQDSLDVSFNWWIGNGNPALDFSPRERPNVGRRKEPFRDFGTGGLGTPEGDANKYYVMSNREFDYNQVFTGVISPVDSLWMYPDQNLADTFAVGYDTRYLLSFGPFEIHPGQTLPISFAYLAGDSIHRVANNNRNLPDDPEIYMSNLDFSDLARNARWADWIYDNPGYDTDGDGFYGTFVACPAESTLLSIDTTIDGRDTTITRVVYSLVDTCWIRGDGVPDFRGASPPPAPKFWVSGDVHRLVVRFNGLRSETTADVFSRIVDFEGYRVYLGRDQRSESFSLVASYDRANYDKYVQVIRPGGRIEWILRDYPFTLQQLRCLYGTGVDPCDDDQFDPSRYTRHQPFSPSGFPDSIIYFRAQGHNVSRLGIDTPLRKRYPDQAYPSSLDPDEADRSELTDDGYLKYFEYELIIDDLLPTVPYWVNVTAFDFGSPESELGALETSVTDGAQEVYALPEWGKIQEQGLKVYVYPNPYRLDGDYNQRGFEGRVETDRPVDRNRLVNFANLPPQCTIGIHTLDGDLVRQIEHNSGAHDTWDLITRNHQLAVSGLYYWTVESPYGATQIGKLVIVR